MGLRLSVTLASALDADQSSVNNLADCWRVLPHEHGEHVDVEYTCKPESPYECCLNIATCPCVAVTETSSSSTGKTHAFYGNHPDYPSKLELRRLGSTVSCVINDHIHQGVVVINATVNKPARSRRRQLSLQGSLEALGDAVDPSWTGLADTEVFGMRRDCRTEICPARWQDCWDKANTGKVLQIQMFLVMHQTFCDSFASTQKCEEYTIGVFRDVNLLYEQQLGISIRPGLVLPPEAFDQFWPELTRYLHSSDKTGEDFVDKFNEEVCDGDKFKRFIGRPNSDFGIFHIIVGKDIQMAGGKEIASNALGLGRIGTLCSCNSVGWSRYAEDRPRSETWFTMAHEVGHNFNGTHFFELAGTGAGADPNSGVMGYGAGKVAGTVAFSDVNKEQICSLLAKIIQKPDGEMSCFRPYFGVAELDPRFGPSYLIMLAGALAVGVLVLLCCCLFLGTLWKEYSLRRRYRRLRKAHHRDVHVLKKQVHQRDDKLAEARAALAEAERKLQEARYLPVSAGSPTTSSQARIYRAEPVKQERQEVTDNTAERGQHEVRPVRPLWYGANAVRDASPRVTSPRVTSPRAFDGGSPMYEPVPGSPTSPVYPRLYEANNVVQGVVADVDPEMAAARTEQRQQKYKALRAKARVPE